MLCCPSYIECYIWKDLELVHVSSYMSSLIVAEVQDWRSSQDAVYITVETVKQR